MAETYAKRKATVVAALRRVRAQYRRADTTGEVLERELDRCIMRKTLIGPETMRNLLIRYEAYVTQVNGMEQPMTDAVQVASSYS